MANNWLHRFFLGSGTQAQQVIQTRADAGDAEAQFSLGLKYSTDAEGEGQDYPQAARYYQLAAEQNHALAQFNLAVMYLEGQGVEQDAAAAETWMKRAAQQGDAGAQFNLGMTHCRASFDRKPVNAAESRIEAYKWFQLAAAQGYKGSAAACEQVNLRMSREDVAEGNHRAALIRAATPPAVTV